MATIYHAIVQPNGKIEIEVPELQPGQSVTITVKPEVGGATAQPDRANDDGRQGADRPKRRAAEILAEAQGHRQFQTAEEVDAYIREERDTWGD